MMFNLHRVDISQFIYFYSKYPLLCHKLLSHKLRFGIVTLKVVPVINQMRKGQAF